MQIIYFKSVEIDNVFITILHQPASQRKELEKCYVPNYTCPNEEQFVTECNCFKSFKKIWLSNIITA